MSSVQSWTGNDIDVALAADFEGSLSCLGIELGTENYDMSAPLHSLMQSVSANDYGPQENGDPPPPSPGGAAERTVLQAKKTRHLAFTTDEDVSIKRFCVSSEDKENNDNSSSSSSQRCRMHSSSAPDLRAAGSSVLSPSSMLSQILDSSPKGGGGGGGGHFQYVLGAATSIATKINEESMTYLNQGQSYEIKLKKLGDLTEMRGKMLKSIVRVGFQERRLQFSEQEQIAQWQSQRPGERILEIDIPLSYGVYNVTNDPNNIHVCDFLWEPTNETGVFIRLNCISTEFTPKKHGGEKGAPFRIQIETFSHAPPQRLHVAACQVKVFKPKGADRKHKTDRDKMSKRPLSEQEKYKTSYDCTVLTECIPDPLYITASSSSFNFISSPPASSSPKMSPDSKAATQSTFSLSSRPSKSDPEDAPTSPLHTNSQQVIKQEREPVLQSSVDAIEGHTDQDLISAEFSVQQTAQWLRRHRFSESLFINYKGSDMLRLSSDDCIRICGNADGVRLYNTLICKPIFPKKVLFVRFVLEEVFQAVYLHDLQAKDLIAKLGLLFDIPPTSILDLRMQMGRNTCYSVSDEVVMHLQNESLYILELLHPESDLDSYILVLKPTQE